MTSDTSPEAQSIQTAAQARLSGAERLAIAVDMSLFARELALLGLRRQHPDWSDLRVNHEILRHLFPSDRIPAPLR